MKNLFFTKLILLDISLSFKMTYCYYIYHLYACLKIHEKPLKIGGFANFEGLEDEKVFFTSSTLYP